MQWLIDIFLEAARVQGFFVDRGDPGDYDFTTPDFTFDNAMHTLDVSGIIPVHAHACSLDVYIKCGAINKHLRFRTDGNLSTHNRTGLITQVANVGLEGPLIVIPSSDRKIQYWSNLNPNPFVEATITGWWY